MASYHSGKAARQRDLLDADAESGAISPADADAIREFMAYDENINKPGTVASHITTLRNVAKRADTELVEMTDAECHDLLRSFMTGTHPDVKDSGIVVNNYVSALRKFYQHHDDLGVDGTAINVDEDYSGRDLTPEDLLYKDEVDDLLAAAQRASVRDMAFIAVLLATGQRVDAVRSLRLKHISRDGPVMEITLNTAEGDLKGASGSKPLLWAKHYVRPWYDSHPHKGNPDAALFPATRNDPTGAAPDADTWKVEPMSQSQCRYIVQERGKEAGLDKNLYPHLLRHCAITRMAIQDLSEQQIKNIVGWSPDSSQFGTYVTLADEIVTDSVRASLGLPTSESGAPVIGRPSLDRCPNCDDQLPPSTERCLTCQTPLTHAAAEAAPADVADDKMHESYRDAEDMDTVEKVQLLDDLLDDPEVRGLLQDRMG